MGILDRFINSVEDQPEAVNFTIADASNPLNWAGLARTVGASVIAGTASALIAIPNGIEEAYTSLFGGATDGIVNLQDTVFDPLEAGVYGIWDVAFVEDLGILALPVAIAIVLLAVYLFIRGARQAVAIFLEGGGIG